MCVCVYVDVGGGEHAVALDGHDREREEGGGAAEEVKGHPDVARGLAVEPEAARARAEEDHVRHDEQADEQVGEGERRDEVVAGRGEEARLAQQRGQDGAVAQHGQRHQRRAHAVHQRRVQRARRLAARVHGIWFGFEER